MLNSPPLVPRLSVYRRCGRRRLCSCELLQGAPTGGPTAVRLAAADRLAFDGLRTKAAGGRAAAAPSVGDTGSRSPHPSNHKDPVTLAAPTGATDRLITMPARHSQGSLPLSLIPRASSPGSPACSLVMRRRREWRATTDPIQARGGRAAQPREPGAGLGEAAGLLAAAMVAGPQGYQARWRAESERSAPAVCRCVEMMGIVILWHARVVPSRRAWNGLS